MLCNAIGVLAYQIWPIVVQALETLYTVAC